MKIYLDCIPCFFRQALSMARIATEDESIHKKVIDRISDEVKKFPLDATSPEMSYIINRVIRAQTNNADIYKALKHEFNQKALAYYPQLRKEIDEAEDPLLMAVRFAVAGNIIDFGPDHAFDFDEELEASRTREFAIFDFDKFKEAYNQAEEILYIGDNTGEIVFDRLLIETLNKPTTFVVRSGPILNDSTREDALEVGIDKIATIIENGSEAPGILFDKVTDEFMEHFNKAQLIISKGMGNFETLSERPDRPIFFMLRAKCDMVAKHLGVNLGDTILKTYIN